MKKNQAILMMILYICVIVNTLVNQVKYSQLIANYIKHKGNKVFEFNKMGFYNMNYKFTIIILIFLILLSLNLIYNHTKSNKNITIKYMDETINKLEKLYSQTKLKSPFEKQPEDNSGLHFGFICPGAIKTVTYLNKHSKTPKTKQLTQEVKKYTDAQFFIEIIIIYQDYISKKLLKMPTK